MLLLRGPAAAAASPGPETPRSQTLPRRQAARPPCNPALSTQRLRNSALHVEVL